MAKYVVEQYELHAQQYFVDASSEAEAIKKVLDGEAEMGEGEYIGLFEDYGMSLHSKPEVADALEEYIERHDSGEIYIPSIRSVTLAKEN